MTIPIQLCFFIYGYTAERKATRLVQGQEGVSQLSDDDDDDGEEGDKGKEDEEEEKEEERKMCLV